MKIGVLVESFRTDFATAVKKASDLGLSGIQKFATNGETEWTSAQIKEHLDIVKSNGLVFSALCGDFGYSFKEPERNAEYIEKSKRVIDLAKKLECNVVTTHIGRIPLEENREKDILRKACRELALYADSIEASFAIETGYDMADTLADFLDSLGAGGVRVNLDPANLVMCAGEDPVYAVKRLNKYIVHTHAKDGIKIDENKFEELPLGQGKVDFDKYLPALGSVGFDGFLTIERECGDDPAADIILATNFLGERLEKYNLK